MKIVRLAVLCCLISGFMSAFASSGDDQAIISACGHPNGENKAISPVNNELQRDLYYPDDIVMHFQPVEGGWNFVSGWVKHYPLTREAMANKFPCVHDALAQAAAEPVFHTDPTIAAQLAHPKTDGENFGIQHLWFIIFLSVLLLVALFFLPARRAKKVEMPEPRVIKRKPEVVVEAERESARMRRVEAERSGEGL